MDDNVVWAYDRSAYVISEVETRTTEGRIWAYSIDR